MRVGEQNIDLRRPVVMTIINITPDSFFSGSRTLESDQIAARVDRAVSEGATILDVGGYSSRPGADDVDEQQEISRVLLGARIIRERHPQMVISVDTFRSGVARALIESYGECIINDISAGEIDPAIIDVAAHYDVPYIAMHMRGVPSTMQQHTDYDDIVEQVRDYFIAKVAQLRHSGVKNIILDPGFGFAKSTRQNYVLLRHLSDLMVDDVPMLIGLSRKSMIYKVLDCAADQALNGTTALHWQALCGGASILRVHDTLQAAEVIKLFEYYGNND